MAASARRSALRGVLAFTARRPLNVSHSFRGLHLGRPAFHSSRHFVHAVVLGVPVIGGGLMFLCPNEESPVPTILASSAVIPCSDDAAFHQQRTLLTHQMSSPNEDHKSLLRRILDFLRDRIWEPFRTGERFLHLLALFLPVMITSPMLFVGKPPKNKRGERWGAVWWYGFLVAQMQRAGPTFIKVRSWVYEWLSFKFSLSDIPLFGIILPSIAAGTMGRLPARPLPRQALRETQFLAFEWPSALARPHEACDRESVPPTLLWGLSII